MAVDWNLDIWNSALGAGHPVPWTERFDLRPKPRGVREVELPGRVSERRPSSWQWVKPPTQNWQDFALWQSGLLESERRAFALKPHRTDSENARFVRVGVDP